MTHMTTIIEFNSMKKIRRICTW